MMPAMAPQIKMCPSLCVLNQGGWVNGAVCLINSTNMVAMVCTLVGEGWGSSTVVCMEWGGGLI